MLRIVLLLSVAVSALGACGNDQDPVVSPAGTTTSTTRPGSDATTAPPTGDFATTTVSTPPTQRGLLKTVTATSDGPVDRVTFTFEDAVPGYRVGYIERPVIQDGSGDEIDIEGAAVLGIHFEPASGFDLTGEGRQVYEGPNRLDLATRVILDVARVGDFEANLEWAIGIDAGETPFRVRTDGRSVIVEVQAP